MPTFNRKTIGIIHSQQPSNQYAGGSLGIMDSEQRWMRELAREVVAQLADTGHDVRLGPTGDAASTFRTNVAWANGQPLDVLISLHSNATGQAGTQATGIGCYYVSAAGKVIAQALANRLRPVSARGQASILSSIKVSELVDTKAPAVLVENEYHDWEGSETTGGAVWIRNADNRTRLAKAYRAAIVDLYGEAVATTPAPADPLVKPTPTTTAAPAFPLPAGSYFGPRYPLSNARSVSGYYSHREDLRRWQQRMRDRGWTISVDGLYGDKTAGVARAFQREKGLAVDGLIGPATWAAAWTAPVTSGAAL